MTKDPRGNGMNQSTQAYWTRGNGCVVLLPREIINGKGVAA